MKTRKAKRIITPAMAGRILKLIGVCHSYCSASELSLTPGRFLGSEENTKRVTWELDLLLHGCPVARKDRAKL